MKALQADFKRMILSLGFWVALVGTVAVALIGSYDFFIQFSSSGSQNTMLGEASVNAAFSAYSSQIVLLVFPFLCVLPYASAFTDDFNSGFLEFYLPRAGRKSYLFSRVSTTAFSAGIAMTSGFLIIFLIDMVAFPATDIAVYSAGTEASFLLKSSDYLLRMPLVFINACIWSLTAGMIAAVTFNKYLGYAFPFIIYYVLSSFQGKYFQDYYLLNPQEWLRPYHIDLFAAYICAAVIFLLVFILYYFTMKRRLRGA